MPSHGQAFDEGIVPHSKFYRGPYGRMFRNLPPHVPTFDLIEPFIADFTNEEIEQAREDSEAGREAILKLLARSMIDKGLDQSEDITGDNPNIPAGYTYFLQFITHDITFDPTSSLMRFNDPNKLRNFRTPRLDLDSLYGNGPDDSPFIYEYDSKNPNRKYYLLFEKGSSEQEHDLPRNSQELALISDPRNDENIIISQLHLAFIKFHNAVMDWLKKNKPELDGKHAFEEAQRLVRWHYQWVILHDFLPKVVKKTVLKQIWKEPDCVGEPKLCFYQWRNQPFIPVEFSVAAFRFGHSMIRTQYNLNYRRNIKNRAILGDTGSEKNLIGFRRLPKFWTVQWDLFLNINCSEYQKSRQLDTHLSHNLDKLPSNLGGKERRSLAASDLLRGYKMGLPSGQAIARAMGIKTPDEKDEPLWYYILKEAKKSGKGRKLGPVGGRIVAEVLIGLLAGDPHSFLNIDPGWQPVLPGHNGKSFRLEDILRHAGVPLTKQYLRDVLKFPIH